MSDLELPCAESLQVTEEEGHPGLGDRSVLLHLADVLSPWRASGGPLVLCQGARELGQAP